jgi:ribonuclease P protein component
MLTKPSQSGGVRVVIIVPKRLDKRSVYRNKTKRKISESISKKVVGESRSFDILIKAKKIISKENEEIYLNHARDLIKKCLIN